MSLKTDIRDMRMDPPVIDQDDDTTPEVYQWWKDEELLEVINL